MSTALTFPTYVADPADVPAHQATGATSEVFDFSRTAWNATPQQVSDFLVLNYLMRPPLPDEEIRVMPAMEVVALYYSIRSQNPQPDKSPIYIVDQKACFGLPQEWAWGYATQVQRRIYSLRPELHYVTHPDTKVTYPLLLPPSQLDYTLGETTLSTVATIIGGILTVVTPAFGILVAAIANTVSTGLRAAATAQALANVSKARGIAQQVLYGISVQSQLADATPTPSDLQSLAAQAQHWQQLVQTASPNVQAICQPSLRMSFPARAVVVAFEADVNSSGFSGPSGQSPGLLQGAHATSPGLWQQNPPPDSWWDLSTIIVLPNVGPIGLTERGINPNYYSLILPAWKAQIDYERSQVQAYVAAWQPAGFFYSDTVGSTVAAYAAAASAPIPTVPLPISASPPGLPAVALRRHTAVSAAQVQPAADHAIGAATLLLLLFL